MMQSFLIHNQNNIFHDIVISLVLYRKVLLRMLFSTFLPNQRWHLLTNKMIDSYMNEPPVMGGSAALWVEDYY